MKVRPIARALFIYPPERALKGFFRANVPPLGAACLAAWIGDRCETAILDAKLEGYDSVSVDGPFEVYGLGMDEIESRVRAFKPDLVGLTCLASFNWPEVKKIAALVKRVGPDILVVAGGTHPAFLYEQCLAEAPEIDLIVRGEGELALSKILDAATAGKNIDVIQGMAFRKEDGTVQANGFSEPVESLDELPFPARHLLDMDGYFETRAPFSRTFRHKRNTSIQTSRGCPAHCTFCSSANFWGHGFRPQSPGRVLAEIEHLIDRYGIRELQFVDDNLVFDRDRAVSIFEGMIERDLGLEWCMPNGVALWRLDPELIALMRRAGCYSMTLAFESGNQRVLSRLVKKPLNLKKVPPLIEEMKRQDVQIHAFFISGFPGETREEMLDTYRLAKSLDLDGAYFFIATPLPGTELCRTCEDEGYIDPDLDFTKIEFNKGHINTPDWTAEEVERLAGSFYLRFMVSVLSRHPLRFFKNYGGVIIKRPGYTLVHFLVFIKRSLLRLLGRGD